MLYANNGKDALPGYAEGKSTSKSRSSVSVRTSSGRIPWAYRFMPGLVGMGAEAYMYDWWRRNPIQYHSTYARNPYERQALRTMAQNRINPYNAIRAAQDAERRGEYRIDQSGGLTGAQRYLAKVAGTLGNAQNMANIYQEADEKNAALRNQYAEAAAKIGEQDAQRAQHANQHDWDDYVAAHGRKTKGIETHIAGFVNQLNHMYANEAKYKMWRDSIAMYQQQLDDEQARWAATFGLARQNAARGSAARPAGVVYNPSSIPSKVAAFDQRKINPSDIHGYPKTTPFDTVSGMIYDKYGYPGLATPPYVDGNRSASPSGNNQSTNSSVTYSPNYFGSWPNQAYRFGNLGNGNTGNRYYYETPFINNLAAPQYQIGRYWQAYPNVQTGFDRYPDQDLYDFSYGIPMRMRRLNGFNPDGTYGDPYWKVTRGYPKGISFDGNYSNRGKDRKKGFRK